MVSSMFQVFLLLFIYRSDNHKRIFCCNCQHLEGIFFWSVFGGSENHIQTAYQSRLCKSIVVCLLFLPHHQQLSFFFFTIYKRKGSIESRFLNQKVRVCVEHLLATEKQLSKQGHPIEEKEGTGKTFGLFIPEPPFHFHRNHSFSAPISPIPPGSPFSSLLHFWSFILTLPLSPFVTLHIDQSGHFMSI